MATRNQAVVAAQPHKARAAEAGKQQKVAAEGKNRRALEDIGNLVNVRIAEGKQLSQVNRPVTRSFGAQLLANAQAAVNGAGAASKKPVDLAIPDGAAKKGGARAAKQKAVAKLKPEKLIEISPDTCKKEKENSVSRVASRGGKALRKKVDTLSSVLTARSKAACGATEKPKESVHDIDAADAGDEFAVTDYVEDIYKFYKLSENACRLHDYMRSQLEINAKMRAILADWLIEVHNKFELMPETLYLTICIIDRYLAMENVSRRELQLVGLSAMLIACKYEEIWAPEIHDFICISDRAYTREQILGMEKRILNKLEWTLTVPTPYMFLVRFVKAAICDTEMENMVYFLSELGLMQYNVMITYRPSMIAAASVYAARLTFNKTPYWTDTLKHYTGFSEQQLLDCTKILVSCHSASTAPEGKLQVVYKKYSSSQVGSVALQTPATKLLEELKASHEHDLDKRN